MSSPELSVIIVTYNSADWIERCLASLPEALDGRTAEVIVVDNASSDGTADLVHGDVRLIRNEHNVGFGAAINAGVAAGTAEWVVMLNPDMQIGRSTLDRLLTFAQANPGHGLYGGRTVTPEGHLDPSSCWALPTLWSTFCFGVGLSTIFPRSSVFDPESMGNWARDSVREVDMITGCLLLTPRAVWDELGGFDERYFVYGEDADLAARARTAGYRPIITPDAVAVHASGASSSAAGGTILLLAGKITYARTHFRGLKGTAATALITLGVAWRGRLLGRAGRGTKWHAAWARRSEWRQGFPNRPGFASPRSAGPGFVLFSAQDYWYHPRSHSDVQLARGLARERRVLLVNTIGMRMPTSGTTTEPWKRIVRKLRSISRGLRRPEAATPNLYVLTPVVIPFYGNPKVRRLNASLVRLQVRVICRALRLRRPHLIVTIPTAWDVAAPMARSSLVVNRSDKFSAFPEIDQDMIAGLESELLANADAAVYVSHSLMEAERPQVVRGESVFLGHGVDFERFAAAVGGPLPADIASIPGPRIGFFGGLDDFMVDFELLERLAVEIPDASLVLIGAATCDISRLVAHPNVHWLGYRDYEEIPAYGAGFDVAIIPKLQNEWVRNINPIKIKEYLSLGLPVVTTYYAEADFMSDVVAIASSPDEFIERVREALDGRAVASAEKRQDSVRGDSWQNRSRELLELADRSRNPAE